MFRSDTTANPNKSFGNLIGSNIVRELWSLLKQSYDREREMVELPLFVKMAIFGTMTFYLLITGVIFETK